MLGTVQRGMHDIGKNAAKMISAGIKMISNPREARKKDNKGSEPVAA